MNVEEFLEVIAQSGIELKQEDERIILNGRFGGNRKPNGPLADKKIGVVVGSEFSDWQAYYLASFIGEFGGVCQFVMDNNHLWKETRPMRGTPVHPHGMWGLSLTGGMDGLGLNDTTKVEYPVVMMESVDPKLKVADPADYDALIVLGDHSGDILVADSVALDWLKAVTDRGVPIAAIGGGHLPLVSIGLLEGKRCTGNKSVDYIMNAIADFNPDEEVVVDGQLISGRDTKATPAVLRALCKVFDPTFADKHKDVLRGKRIMFMICEDWEDIEFCGPVMELMYRGADLIMGLFEPETRSRHAMLGLDVRQGSYGTTIPFQEIPLSDYSIVKESDLEFEDYDALFIPGAFNPWQITVLHRDYIVQAYKRGKLITSICHGPIPVAAADIVKGRKMAGWLACTPSIESMGGTHVLDAAAIIDGPIVTGQTPPQVPEFCDVVTLALLDEGE